MKSFKKIIQSGGVAVIRTDTIYGLVADAKNQKSVSRIYAIKKRNLLKPVIVLVSNLDQIRSFDVTINSDLEITLNKYWPGKVSIILSPNDISMHTHYIHKGTGGIAFRIPDDNDLRNILEDVGPLVAPSANPEGFAPAENIQQAMDYFGDTVDYYVDGGDVTDTKPSMVIKISNSMIKEIIRK
jgi:L-threonylcarbamoyladenylate synthase